jgi:hypothetical protein
MENEQKENFVNSRADDKVVEEEEEEGEKKPIKNSLKARRGRWRAKSVDPTLSSCSGRPCDVSQDEYQMPVGAKCTIQRRIRPTFFSTHTHTSDELLDSPPTLLSSSLPRNPKR